MRPKLPTSGHRPEFPGAIPVLLGAAILLAALSFLPGPVLFLAVLGAAVALAVSLAELRRHGGPEVPHLPLAPER